MLLANCWNIKLWLDLNSLSYSAPDTFCLSFITATHGTERFSALHLHSNSRSSRLCDPLNAPARSDRYRLNKIRIPMPSVTWWATLNTNSTHMAASSPSQPPWSRMTLSNKNEASESNPPFLSRSFSRSAGKPSFWTLCPTEIVWDTHASTSRCFSGISQNMYASPAR